MKELLEWLIPTLASAYAVYTFTAIGSTIVERSGILNLAIDGLFVLSSSLAYTYAIYFSIALQPGTLATFLSVVFTAITTALLYSAYTTLNTVLPVSQGAVGLSFMFVGYGLGAIVGNLGRVSFSLYRVRVEYIGVAQSGAIFVYLLVVLVVAVVHLVLYKLKLGVLVRAVGEDPRLVGQTGISVVRARFLSGLVSGMLIGLGGALFTLWRVGGWSQGQGLNHGWLGYAISIAGWRYPPLIAIVSVFFSLAYVLLPYLQSAGLPVEVSTSAPYAISIAAMVVVSITHRKSVTLLDPKSLGRAFFIEEQA
ncbi:MAG: hypothetical protein RMH84_06000 [Sulfolobales archaeon]|nr:hypothetical protein [Sulfolobales archaeon]MCX8208206.1 hypothetical protein [Sulfolobales archaeon]MDW8011125.1 hypothetical protein [Sulfolobales archaeon]